MNQRWFKSSSSAGYGACVEVSVDGPAVAIRDSKYRRDPHNVPMYEPIILVPASQWHEFLIQAVSQGVAPASAGQPISIEHAPDGTVTLCSTDGTTLTYTPTEWAAFVDGIHRGEFALGDTVPSDAVLAATF